MKIITVDTPYDKDGKWIVHVDRFRTSEKTLKDFFKRIETENIPREEKMTGKKIDGIYLYDVGMLYQEIETGKFEICCYPRWAFIKTEILINDTIS